MKVRTRGQGDELEICWDHQWVNLLDPPQLDYEQEVFLCQWVARQWDRMPNGMVSDIVLPPIFSQPKGSAVVFYAGSFYPWHRGHRACLELTPQKPIVVVPDVNPWKERLKQHRPWQAILALLNQIDLPCSLYPGFLVQDGGNPTVDWLPQTHWEWRGFTLGADSFITLSGWKNVEQLLAALDILYVVPRLCEKSAFEAAQAQLILMAPNLEIVILPHHDYEHLMSSRLR